MKKRGPIFTWLIIAASAVFVLAPFFQHDPESGFHLREFGRLPVLLNGRIKPLDTVARNSLLIIHGRQTIHFQHGATLSAIEWLTELLMNADQADEREIFVIRNPDTLVALGWGVDAG